MAAGILLLGFFGLQGSSAGAADRALSQGSVTEPYGEEMPPPKSVGARPASEVRWGAAEDVPPDSSRSLRRLGLHQEPSEIQGLGVPWHMSGSMSLNWRNVGPREPGFETQIQNELYLADMYFGFHGPAMGRVPFWMEFQMPTGNQGQPNLFRIFFEYTKFRNWDFEAGKFLVPFGRYNELYRPDMFLTLTRPLLYASPDSLDLVVRINSPRPPFSSGYADIGARASYYPPGDHRFVPGELTFYVVNGLGESQNRSRTFPSPNNLGIPPPPPTGVSIDFGHENNNLADNNNDKTLGARAVYSLGTLDLPWPIPEGKRDLDGMTIGLSGMAGRYNLEGDLPNRMAGIDVAFEYQGFNISSEYVYSDTAFRSPMEVSSNTLALASPTQQLRQSEQISGYFVQASYPLLRKPRWGKRLTGVVVYNQMFRVGPALDLLINQVVNGTTFPSIGAVSAAPPRIHTEIDKVTLGLNLQVTEHLTSKFDYSYWGLQHSTTLSTPTKDIYQWAFSLVLSF